MKKVIFAETPYQVIVSLYIKNQYSKKNDKVDLIITDTFNGYMNLYNNLINKNIFNNVFIAKAKDLILPKSVKKRIKKLYYILFPKKMIKKSLGTIDFYDEIYCWNYDAFIANIRSYFALNKNPAHLFMYDEGYISYFPLDEVIPKRGFLKIIEFRNKLVGIRNIVRENIDGILLIEPDLLIKKPNYPVLNINRNQGQTDEFRKLIKELFNTHNAIQNYDKKFIIFEEAMFSNSDEFDDEKVILDIVDKVGKENVLIKLHPRTKIDRFSKLGIKTLGSDGIPWEAITLTGDFSNKILIAIGSGSIVNYRLTYGKNMRAILMFKLFKTNLKYLSSKYDKFWNKLKSTYPEGGIYIPETMEELDRILTNIGELNPLDID